MTKNSIFSKKRSELTSEELDEVRQYDKNRYYNKRKKSRRDMTPEELAEVRAKDPKQKTFADMTPEEIEIARAKNEEYNREYNLLHPKTDAQKELKREYDKKRRENFTPEQKEKQKENRRKFTQNNKARPDIRYKYLLREAKKYNLEVSLTLDEYAALISKPCYYCEDKMNTPSFGRGLDRIDNDQGYHIHNVLPCCTTCNQLRSNVFTVEETKIMILSLLEFRKPIK